ncbi:MAG: restriction endonuclease [Oscillospiraceae bacterium]|nr:restriction endonuclease [Oscillospiraceae bacterium]
MYMYSNLKRSKHDLPTWDALIPVVMHVALQRATWHVKELKAAVAGAISLPEELRHMIYESGNGIIIEDRASWAISILCTAGLLKRPRRGEYQVSELGQQLYQQHGSTLSETIVKSTVEYLEHLKRTYESSTFDETTTTIVNELGEDADTPVATMEQAFSTINAALKDELLNEIMQQDAVFFEKLVVKLLMKMGYGGMLDGEGIVTSRSHDEGIDGIIREDKLGFSNIFIQAKRHALDSTIGRPDVQTFAGAIARKEGKGLFVTTAKFAKPAIEFAKENHIVLINGNDLANLMMEYNLGVSTERTYEIKKVLSDFDDCLS